MLSLRAPLLGAAVAFALLACGKGGSPNDELRRDLDLLGRNDGLELLSSGERTDVISNLERSPESSVAAPARPSGQSHSSVQPRQVEEPPVAVNETPAEPSPAAQPSAPSSAPAARPRPTPRAQPGPPPGGYKTVEEVIRNAPFPINP